MYDSTTNDLTRLSIAQAGKLLTRGEISASELTNAFLKRIDAVYLSLVSLVTPILAVILGALVLGETIDARIVLGTALIVSGVGLVNVRRAAIGRLLGRAG